MHQIGNYEGSRPGAPCPTVNEHVQLLRDAFLYKLDSLRYMWQQLLLRVVQQRYMQVPAPIRHSPACIVLSGIQYSLYAVYLEHLVPLSSPDPP